MKSPMRMRWRSFLIVSWVLLTGTLFALVMRERVWKVSGISMLPNFQDESRLVLIWNGDIPQRGDVVLINVDVPLDRSAKVWLKRIIGCPGDTVRIVKGSSIVLINNVPLNEPYLKDWAIPIYENTITRTLLSGEYWVMGDNRNVSCDSRSIGAVRLSQILHILGNYFSF
jgi:signal peptidase I